MLDERALGWYRATAFLHLAARRARHPERHRPDRWLKRAQVLVGEAARYDPAGQLLTGSLLDYPIPRATDLPPQFEILHLETPAPATPAGIKGMGEGGTIGAVAAVANAVADALRSAGADGVRDVPVRPEHVLTALGQGPR